MKNQPLLTTVRGALAWFGDYTPPEAHMTTWLFDYLGVVGLHILPYIDELNTYSGLTTPLHFFYESGTRSVVRCTPAEHPTPKPALLGLPDHPCRRRCGSVDERGVGGVFVRHAPWEAN